MRAFVCRRCRELVPFESQECRRCGALLGFDPFSASLEPLQPAGPGLVRFDLDGTVRGVSRDDRWARCARSAVADCNWLVPFVGAGKPCISCRLTLNLPPKGDEEYRDAYSKAEMAKRRLVFQLRQLDLPLIGRDEDPEQGLAFELLASDRHVVTGHENGVVTIDLNETDDAFREQTRAQFGEPYRTLLGHFRHEVGHYYWARLIADQYRGVRRRGDRRRATASVGAAVLSVVIGSTRPAQSSEMTAWTTRRLARPITQKGRPTGAKITSAPMPRCTRSKTGPRLLPITCTSGTLSKQPPPSVSS